MKRNHTGLITQSCQFDSGPRNQILRRLMPTEYLTMEHFKKQFSEADIADFEAKGVDIAAAIAAANSRADTYICIRYPIPLQTIPDFLRDTVGDICRYSIAVGTKNEDLRKRYEDALKTLTNISKGTQSLGIALPAEAKPSLSFRIGRGPNAWRVL